jgi:lipopolysaccharide transport system permease protein
MNMQQESTIDAARQKLFDWSELWRFRELVYYFTWRDVKIKYKQTFLGFLWAILQPLLMMLILTYFFGKTLKIPSQQLPYPVFVFSGLLIWNTFSSGLTNSANSMVSNAMIIKKIYFPRLIIPVSSILVSVFDFLMAFLILLLLLLYYQQPVGVNALWNWPLAIIITSVATLGPGSWLAALNIKYRDFRYVIPFLLQALFFLSPIVYPVSMVDSTLIQYLLVASPLYAAIELFRLPLTHAEPNLVLIAISLSSSVFFLIGGLWYFKRTEDYFADFA